MKNKKMIALVTAIIAVVALFTGLLVACNNNKALINVTNADLSGNVIANYGKGYSLYNNKNKQVIKEFYDYMEIAEEGYLLASNNSDKGISILDYSGNVLISGVNNDYQTYEFEMNRETIADTTSTNAMGKPTVSTLKKSVAYITATDSERVKTIFSPSGKQIVKLEDTDDTEYEFYPNTATNVVKDNTTTTTSVKLLSSTVAKVTSYEKTETRDEYTEITLTIYDSSFKEIYSRTSQSMSSENVEDGVNFACIVRYEVSDEYKVDIVSQDGSVKTFKHSEVELSYDDNLYAVKEAGATDTKIYNTLTGKTLTVNGTVNGMYETENDLARIILNDGSTQIIDMNNMSLKLNLDSHLSKNNLYFYSTADAVYDANFNKIDGVTGFVKTLLTDSDNNITYSLLKKTNDTYVLYKNADKVAEVPSSIARDYSSNLITYTDASGVKQYAHISAPNKPLYSVNNTPTLSGYSVDLKWFVLGDNLYVYNTNTISTMSIGSKINSYDISLSPSIEVFEDPLCVVYSLKLSAKDGKVSDQYKLLLVTMNGINVIASGESKFTVTLGFNDEVTIKNNEQYLHGDISNVDGIIEFKLNDYSSIKNIEYITDKYVVTKNPTTEHNAVYLDGKIILPALYEIEEIQDDYVIFKDNFNVVYNNGIAKKLLGLIKLEKDGYKVIEKAKFDRIDILNKDYIQFTETKKGEPSISLKNMSKNKFVFKNAYSVTQIETVTPSTMNINDKYSITCAYTAKKGGNTKLVRFDIIAESID